VVFTLGKAGIEVGRRDGRLTDMVNRTRAKDAAYSLVRFWLPRYRFWLHDYVVKDVRLWGWCNAY
jgi:hypothetical protein